MRALALLLVVALAPAAQVRAWQTVSATEGGFAGPLRDGDRFGVSAAAPGDLDGDGTADVVVGAYGDTGGRGAVWVLFLRPDGTVRESRPVRLADGAAGDAFGVSATALGDLDGDGRPEVAVGADRRDDGGTDRGAVTVLSLGPDGAASVLQTISATQGGLQDPPADGDLFGHSVSALGDVDGDGTPDLAVGGDDADDGGPERGAVWVLFLRPDGSVRQSQRVSDTAGGFDGVLDDRDLFGQSVAGLGDLDGDGTPDLAVSATLDDDGADDAGAVWVLFLNADGTVREHQKISATEGGFAGALDRGDVFGASLVARDADGDGTPDLLVGANRDDDGGPNRGAGWLLFLRPDGTVRAHQKVSATQGGAVGPFGDGDEWSPAASLGDLDGDGGLDWIWGSRLAGDGGPTRGAARVLFTGYAVATERAPLAVALAGPWPNPARLLARVEVTSAGPALVEVFDVLGRRVLSAPVAAGADRQRLVLDVSAWAPGVYRVRLRSGTEAASRALTVVR